MNDLHSLTGAYALNALAPEEEQRFEKHLADCPECVWEVASFAETAAVLSQAVATAPPAELRQRVLDASREVRQLPPPPAPTTRTARRLRRRTTPWLVAAAAVVAIGVGTAVVQPWHDDASPTGPGSTTATQGVLEAADAERVSVSLGQANATVVRSKALNGAVIITENMPAAPQGSEYVLWLQSPEGEMRPAGVMPRKRDQTLALLGDAAAATAVGITTEPEGSNAQTPTSDPIALFMLS